MNFHLKTLGLTHSSKILSLTHAYCLDGSCAQIVLENVFKNVTSVSLKYDNIDSELENYYLKEVYGRYDFIFLTDIAPQNPELLKGRNKIILLDHHNTAIANHNPSENKYVIPDKYSGSSLTKRFCEDYFGVKLNHLDDLIYLSQDYDLWHKKNAKSTFLNELHFYYYSEVFRKRFFNGDTRFTPDEIKYLRKRKLEFKEVYDKLEIAELSHIKACVFFADKFLNEICEKIMKEEDYGVIFCKHPSKSSISVRTNLPRIDLGKVLKEMGLGGGHPQAAGFSILPSMDLYETLNLVCRLIKKEIKDNGN